MHLLLILLFGITTIARAQVDTLWNRAFGDTWDEASVAVHQTPDGGFIIGGTTTSFGPGTPYRPNVWLVKTDTDGNMLWDRVKGSDETEECSDVLLTSDGGVLIVGRKLWHDANISRGWVVKTDNSGYTIWENTYGPGYSFVSATETADGYVLGGNSASDFWLMKIGLAGNSLWSRTYGGSGSEFAQAACYTSDGGFAIAGNAPGYSSDVWLIKTDENGDSTWSRMFGSVWADRCHSLEQTADGGYIVGGYTNSYFADEFDAWIFKTDAQGNLLWNSIFGESGWDVGYGIIESPDGTYLLCGRLESNDGNHDGWMIKIDVDGDSLWTRTFGGDEDDEFYDISATTDNGYILTGYTRSFGGAYDFWLLKTTPELATDDFILSPSSFSLSNYPNPFNSSTTISFELPRASRVLLNIFDLTGRSVATLADEAMYAGSHSINFDAATLPSGIYVYRLTGGEVSQARKLILLK